MDNVIKNQDKTRYCPYCNEKLGHNGKNKVDSSGFGNLTYGSPIVICDKCGRESLDSDIHEIAIEGINQNEYSLKNKLKLAFIFLALGLLSTGIHIYEVTCQNYYHEKLAVAAFVFLALFVVMIIYSLYIALGFRAKKIENIKQKSIERLKNTEYAQKLNSLGYPVPEEYLTFSYRE